MNFLKPINLVKNILGVISLGVISSALWDAIKPVSRFLFEKILNVSVLGIEKYKDGIYQDIAKGHHENVSLEIFIFINAILVGFAFATLFIHLIKFLYLNGDENTTQKIESALKWSRTLTKRPVLIFLFFYSIFFLTIFSLNLVKTKYTNQAVTYYTQMITITKPYMDQEELMKIESQFAQIESKSDYVEVIDGLKQVAKENDLNEPEFSFIF